MRRAMFNTVEEYVRNDEKNVLMLLDIGAMAFKNLLSEIPERAMNIGIFESGTISVAAGMALCGLNPIVYGITPFIAERALEQLKLNFVYQSLGGTFITTGAAYDFGTLGYSHYCPEDAGVIKQIPDIDFIAPGTASQMEQLLRATIGNGRPTFFRMSDISNKLEYDVEYGKASVIKEGKRGVVIAVSTTLDLVMETLADEDVTILYYTTLAPFDYDSVKKYCGNGRVLICEPQQKGTLLRDIHTALAGEFIKIEDVGLPHEVFRNYGTAEEKNKYYGFTKKNLYEAFERLMR